MKRLSALSAFGAFSLLLSALVAPASEAPTASQQQVDQVLALAKEVQVQQATIADNQAKIEAKLAAIAESLRVARIFSTRGGGRK